MARPKSTCSRRKAKSYPCPLTPPPVDFAYAVHTEVGHRTMGARVNGRLVPLDTTLDNGDTVEILTSKSDTAGPSRDWLSFVKSPKARNKIRQWFSKERRTEAIEEGRDELTRAMRKRNLPVNTLLTPEALVGVADDLNFPNADAVFAAIGDGQVSTQNVISHLVKDAGADEVDEEVEQEVLPLKPMERKASSSSTGVSVKGVGECVDQAGPLLHGRCPGTISSASSPVSGRIRAQHRLPEHDRSEKQAA